MTRRDEWNSDDWRGAVKWERGREREMNLRRTRRKARQHATGARPLATPAHASITSPFSPHHHPILYSSDTRPPCTTTITPRTSPASLQCHHSTYAPSLPLPAWSDTGRGWYGTTRIYASVTRAYIPGQPRAIHCAPAPSRANFRFARGLLPDRALSPIYSTSGTASHRSRSSTRH